jgi:hypothetical protein
MNYHLPISLQTSMDWLAAWVIQWAEVSTRYIDESTVVPVSHVHDEEEMSIRWMVQRNNNHPSETRFARFFLVQNTKTMKLYQMTMNYTKCPLNITKDRKMDKVFMKYTNIFHCKTIQNLSKFGFWVRRQTIWQPCPKRLLPDWAKFRHFGENYLFKNLRQ